MGDLEIVSEDGMPYTFNGIGTRFYGCRDKASDGSYVTTEWFTFVYIPLIPIRSLRVLPVGEGTNYVIHSSQSYQTMRVPLCWSQVRNVYMFIAPIVLVILYFNRQDINDWVRDLRKPPTSSVQTEPPKPAEHPLSDKDAVVACGKVLKLGKDTFGRLDLRNKLSAVVDNAGFTDEEFKELGSHNDMEEEAFSAYSLAYLTWEKPKELSRASLDKMIVDVVHSPNLPKMSSDEIVVFDAYVNKMKRVMLNSFDLGRQDARMSPCRL